MNAQVSKKLHKANRLNLLIFAQLFNHFMQSKDGLRGDQIYRRFANSILQILDVGRSTVIVLGCAFYAPLRVMLPRYLFV